MFVDKVDALAKAVQKELPWMKVRVKYRPADEFNPPAPGIKAFVKLSNGRIFWRWFCAGDLFVFADASDVIEAVRYFEKEFDDWLWADPSGDCREAKDKR